MEEPNVVKRQWRRHPIEISFICLTLLFFGTLVGFAWVITDVRNLAEDTRSIASDNEELVKKNVELTQANKDRISDIERNRIETCEAIYDGIFKVFRPFFPAETHTQEERDNINKFKSTINDLKLECPKLIKFIKGEPHDRTVE